MRVLFPAPPSPVTKITCRIPRSALSKQVSSCVCSASRPTSLWRGEERVPLSPKAFDLLRYLVEHANRVVPQEEILDAVWPQSQVNPELVKKYVLGIRKVLGDRRDKPVFIETVHKRGYQFVAPVRDESGSITSDSAASISG